MGCLLANLFTQCRLFIKARACQYEARRLSRDAITIIKSGEVIHHSNFLENVVREVNANLELAQDATQAGETRVKVRERLRAIHRETRRRRNEAGLSAATLAIIHIRARELGGPGKAALDVIDTFRREWGES